MQVDGKSNCPTANPTVTTGSAYAAGQIIGGLITLSAAFQKAGTGFVYSITIADKSKQDAPIDVIFFNQKPAGTYNDKAAFNPSAADLLNMSGVAKVLAANYSDFSSNSLASLNAIGLVVRNAVQATGTVPADTNLYCIMVSRGTPTYTGANDVQLTVGLIQD